MYMYPRQSNCLLEPDLQPEEVELRGVHVRGKFSSSTDKYS